MVKIKRIREIEVGPTCSKELDVEGSWTKRWGVPIVIGNFDFLFIPTTNPMNVEIDAYSLDSLKVFDSFKISHKIALHQCATEEGFIRAIMPLAIRIDKNLGRLEESKWKSILKSERATAIAECGARNEKERKFIDDFLKD